MKMMITVSYLKNSTLSKMGLIILKMDQPAIMRVITRVIMMVLTHTLHLNLVKIKNLQDTIAQNKKSIQHTTQ